MTHKANSTSGSVNRIFLSFEIVTKLPVEDLVLDSLGPVEKMGIVVIPKETAC